MIEYNPSKCYAVLLKIDKKTNIQTLEQCSSLIKKNDIDNDLYYCGHHKLNKTNKRLSIDNYKEILNKYENIINPQNISIDEYISNQNLDNVSIINIYYTLKNYYKLNLNFYKPEHIKKVLTSYYNNFIESTKYTDIYKKIQLKYRSKYNLKKILLQGPGYINHSIINNDTDFFTLENIIEIPNKFFFSFLDKNGFYYGFDIRSLKQLLNYNNKNNDNKNNDNKIFNIGINSEYINPYSTLPLINNVVKRIINLINKLESDGYSLSIINDIELTPKQKMRNSIMKVFNMIDNFGYQTNIDWMTSMKLNDLKKLYAIMEDIWNYRCNLSMESKLEIIPNERIYPLFYFSVDYVYTIKNYNNVLDIVLKVFERLLTESNQIACRSLGAIYIISGITFVSIEAASTYPDLILFEDD